MASPDLSSTDLISAALVAAVLVVAIRVYSLLVDRLRTDGGQVQTEGLDLPDLLVSFVLASTFGALVARTVLAGNEKPAVPEVEHVLPSSLIFVFLVAGIVGFLRYRGVRLAALFGLNKVSVWRGLGWAAVLLVATLPFVAMINWLTLSFMRESAEQQPLVQLFREVARGGDYSAMATIFLAGVVIAPICEEILFRGYFYPVGKRYLGPWISGFLTAALFGAFHANLASLPGLSLLAVAFTLAYERTGSLLVPISMHAFFNATSLGLLYLQATGVLPS